MSRSLDFKSSACNISRFAKYFVSFGVIQKQRSSNPSATGAYICDIYDDIITNEFHDVGVLFRLDEDLTLNTVLTGLTIPNGIGCTYPWASFLLRPLFHLPSNLSPCITSQKGMIHLNAPHHKISAFLLMKPTYNNQLLFIYLQGALMIQ